MFQFGHGLGLHLLGNFPPRQWIRWRAMLFSVLKELQMSLDQLFHCSFRVRIFFYLFWDAWKHKVFPHAWSSKTDSLFFFNFLLWAGSFPQWGISPAPWGRCFLQPMLSPAAGWTLHNPARPESLWGGFPLGPAGAKAWQFVIYGLENVHNVAGRWSCHLRGVFRATLLAEGVSISSVFPVTTHSKHSPI